MDTRPADYSVFTVQSKFQVIFMCLTVALKETMSFQKTELC